jgi:serine/threonine-protein kinase RsbT
MQERIELYKESDLHTAALRSRQFALNAGFDAVHAHKLATATSELTRNVYKYANCRGTVFITLKRNYPEICVEVEVRDQGPGIKDLDAAMRDHYSTSGTLGLGLPGVKRLVDELSINSTPGQGTTVIIRMKTTIG